MNNVYFPKYLTSKFKLDNVEMIVDKKQTLLVMIIFYGTGYEEEVKYNNILEKYKNISRCAFYLFIL